MTKVKEAEITMQITNDILYVGVNDHQVDLFEVSMMCRMEWRTTLM